MIEPTTKDAMPTDVKGAIREMKQNLRQQIGDVEAAFAEVSALIEREVETIEAKKAKGKAIWPVIAYTDIEQGKVSSDQVDDIHRRGCAIIKGHFPREVALDWDERLVEYVERNDFDRIYRGPGDNFFGTLSASRPEIYPIYWSSPQMEARQSERMAKVQGFLNHLWKFESEGQKWFDPNHNTLYPDRIRRRPPGTDSDGLGAHTDSGALERWLLPAYQRVFRHIFSGNIDRYDPWDAAHRTEVNEYPEGTTLCSAFRTFQGWTALSDTQHDQGVLFTVPIPMAMAYILLRPLQNDVPEDELCGVTPGHVLPLDDKWHPLLMRAITTITDIEAGDTVWWHSDLIHGVGKVKNQQGWANVMYIPATPLCEKNASYAQQVTEKFLAGKSPSDFPEEDYEMDWSGRFMEDDLNEIGRQSLCGQG